MSKQQTAQRWLDRATRAMYDTIRARGLDPESDEAAALLRASLDRLPQPVREVADREEVARMLRCVERFELEYPDAWAALEAAFDAEDAESVARVKAAMRRGQELLALDAGRAGIVATDGANR